MSHFTEEEKRTERSQSVKAEPTFEPRKCDSIPFSVYFTTSPSNIETMGFFFL